MTDLGLYTSLTDWTLLAGYRMQHKLLVHTAGTRL